MILRQAPSSEILRGERAFEQVILTLEGAIPSKKNKLRPRGGKRRSRGLMYDARTRAALDAITTQARGGWGPRRPVAHPDVEVEVWSSDHNQDRDGIWTTVLDCMKQAGVIFDDATKWFNGRISFPPAKLVARVQEERCIVRLTFPKGEASGKSRKTTA